jgi:hypothetical protein
VLERFNSDELKGMEAWPQRFMILLMDFDGREDRLDRAKATISKSVADRVFVLGAWTYPEALKADLGSYEQIGSAMADDCRNEANDIWGHSLLQHNASELERLRQLVRSVLF